ncbi:MAG: hypothetical protein AAF371_00720 [Pseudomonadota bacterium]
MKKKRRRKGPAKPKGATPPAAAPKRRARSRREILMMARNIAIGLGVAGGIGYVSARSVMASIAEHDLDRIGDGTPAIVQIHDPECALCRSLQVATREALAEMEAAGDGEGLTYLVANIKTDEGRQLASRHGVGHVTLLLFDGRGRLRHTIRGQRTPQTLRIAFERHLRENAPGG